MKKMSFVVMLFWVIMTIRNPVMAQNVAVHSIATEFAIVQGDTTDSNQSNNWYYQYMSKTSEDFALLTQLTNTNDKGWYNPVQINREGGIHPTQNENAVLTWISTYDDGTSISITGQASKFDSNNGNGTLVSIYKNDLRILGPLAVTTMENTIAMVKDDIVVDKGDAIHFVVDSNGSAYNSHYFDYTRWSPIIQVNDSEEGIIHRSSIEYASEQGNVIDDNQNNNWIYQYKYNISDSMLPSNGYEADNSKIFNLEAFWDNPSYTAISSKAIRPEDVNNNMWSTAMLTRAWMGHGHNVFVGNNTMQPCYGYDAVKTWVNTYNEPKELQIRGTINLINANLDASGVEVLIMKDSSVLYKEQLSNNTPAAYDVTTTVYPGDKIYFLVHQISNMGQNEKDYTMRNRVNWDPSISVLDSTASNPVETVEDSYEAPVPQLNGSTYSYSPTDIGNSLNNPEMGLHFAYYDNFLQHYGDGIAPSDTLDYFEGMNVLYLRVPWSFVEPQDEQYDWSKFDELINHWTAKGKKIGLRFTSQELEEQAAPLWLKTKGAGGYYRGGTFGQTWVPHSGDSIFQNEYKQLLQEVARKYGDNPAVEFIEMGALGVWGEGHGGHSLTDFRTFGNMFREVFPNKILLWPDDSGSGVYSDSVATAGFGLYDDSIGWSNKMGNIHAANRFWKNHHVRVEMTHYYEGGARGFFMDTPEKLLQSIENIHGSYFLVHGYPDRFWDESADIVRKINKRIGYRLNIEEISWPKSIASDTTTSFEVKLRNAGVAPNYKGGHVSVTILNENNQVIAQGTNTTFNTRDLVVKDNQRDKTTYSADEVTAIQIPVTLPDNTPVGEYKVYVSIGEADGQPIYELPYGTDVEQKKYLMGSLQVVDQLQQYNITVDNNIAHGNIQVSSSTATEGEVVTITALPDAGYALHTITVNDQIIVGNTFSMPAEDAIVTATFNRQSHQYSAEYGNTQGNVNDADHTNNWLYQYVPYTNTQTYTPSVSGILDMVYDGNKWVREVGSYPTIQPGTIHPDNGYDSVITWVNTYGNNEFSQMRIQGSANKFDSNGNGVKVTIMKDSQIIWGPSVITDTTVTSFDVTTPITNGERIHFVINQNSPLVGSPSSNVQSRWFDSAHLESTIQPIE